MTKAQFAELLLRALGGGRAAEIVGDLLEEHPASSFAFWRAILSTLLHFTWRWAVAIPIAACSIFYGLLHSLDHMGVAPGSKITTAHGIYWILVAACIWSVVVLNAIRFGVRNRLNIIGCILVFLLEAIAFRYVQHADLRIVAAGLAAFTVVCLSLPSLRAAFLSLLASAAAFGCSSILLLSLVALMLRMHSLPFIFISMQFYASLLFSFLVEAVMLSFMRRLFLPEESQA